MTIPIDTLDNRNAYDQLMGYLKDGEIVEGLVIGDSNWDYPEQCPAEIVGRVLTLDEAKPYLQHWNMSAYNTHPMHVWTNKRVITLIEVEGYTGPHSVPRHPINCCPVWDEE